MPQLRPDAAKINFFKAVKREKKGLEVNSKEAQHLKIRWSRIPQPRRLGRGQGSRRKTKQVWHQEDDVPKRKEWSAVLNVPKR